MRYQYTYMGLKSKGLTIQSVKNDVEQLELLHVVAAGYAK